MAYLMMMDLVVLSLLGLSIDCFAKVCATQLSNVEEVPNHRTIILDSMNMCFVFSCVLLSAANL